MAVESINLSEQTILQIIEIAGSIGIWVKAIGIFALIWLIYQIVAFFSRRKHFKTMLEINQRLERIENILTKKKLS